MGRFHPPPKRRAGREKTARPQAEAQEVPRRGGNRRPSRQSHEPKSANNAARLLWRWHEGPSEGRSGNGRKDRPPREPKNSAGVQGTRRHTYELILTSTTLAIASLSSSSLSSGPKQSSELTATGGMPSPRPSWTTSGAASTGARAGWPQAPVAVARARGFAGPPPTASLSDTIFAGSSCATRDGCQTMRARAGPAGRVGPCAAATWEAAPRRRASARALREDSRSCFSMIEASAATWRVSTPTRAATSGAVRCSATRGADEISGRVDTVASAAPEVVLHARGDKGGTNSNYALEKDTANLVQKGA